MARYVINVMDVMGPENLDFQGPPLSMPLVMMLHPSKSLSISAIKTTGT